MGGWVRADLVGWRSCAYAIFLYDSLAYIQEGVQYFSVGETIKCCGEIAGEVLIFVTLLNMELVQRTKLSTLLLLSCTHDAFRVAKSLHDISGILISGFMGMLSPEWSRCAILFLKQVLIRIQQKLHSPVSGTNELTKSDNVNLHRISHPEESWNPLCLFDSVVLYVEPHVPTAYYLAQMIWDAWSGNVPAVKQSCCQSASTLGDLNRIVWCVFQ